MYYWAMPATPDSTWTFLSNHGHALIQLARNPDLKVVELASLIGITERSTLSIISDLESDGYVSVERIGRRNRYKVNPRKKFRHPGEADHSIGELLEIFSE
jgi:DNA-binding transcriptional ArsR family regulator